MEREPYPFETSRPGVFAAGDVRHGSVKRVAGAVGEGSVAVGSVHQYLADPAGSSPAMTTKRAIPCAGVTGWAPKGPAQTTKRANPRSRRTE